MRIARAIKSDAKDWLDMRHALWPEGSRAEHRGEIAALLADAGDTCNLIVRDDDGAPMGFAEASLRRDYVNGCETSPVAFLEGIYVTQNARGRGAARHLVAALEQWAREQGCTEFASDAIPDNQASLAMHEALGFTETERVVFFRKILE